jgi:hypothetical protein
VSEFLSIFIDDSLSLCLSIKVRKSNKKTACGRVTFQYNNSGKRCFTRIFLVSNLMSLPASLGNERQQTHDQKRWWRFELESIYTFRFICKLLDGPLSPLNPRSSVPPKPKRPSEVALFQTLIGQLNFKSSTFKRSDFALPHAPRR